MAKLKQSTAKTLNLRKSSFLGSMSKRTRAIAMISLVAIVGVATLIMSMAENGSYADQVNTASCNYDRLSYSSAEATCATTNPASVFQKVCASRSDFAPGVVANAHQTLFRLKNKTFYSKARTDVVTAPMTSDYVIPCTQDFTGDGADDFTVVDTRWQLQNNYYIYQWFVKGGIGVVSNSGGDDYASVQWGKTGDIPVAGSFKTASKADITVFRPTEGRWYIKGWKTVQFGMEGDVPLARDIDGVPGDDLVIYRPSNNRWYIDYNKDGKVDTQFQYGIAGDVPVPADYNGDGKEDIAMYRPSKGYWYIDTNVDGKVDTSIQWGLPGDVPIPANYDGKKGVEIAAYRPSNSTWYLQKDKTSVRYGDSSLGDIPTMGR